MGPVSSPIGILMTLMAAKMYIAFSLMAPMMYGRTSVKVLISGKVSDKS